MPAHYRVEDAKQGYPLRGLLRIVAGQVRLVKEDIDRLRDNLYIETAEDWVLPYIGDLVGNIPLREVTHRMRADVAKTIYYRRRKGTLPMLEEMAADVTGWSARAVDFFEIIGWTQNLNHLRMKAVRTPDFRNRDLLDRVGGPWDEASHTIDVRPPGQREGWHGLPNVGFFLWRLGAYPLEKVAPAPLDAAGTRFHFSPLGHPAPIFHDPPPGAASAGPVTELQVRGPIRPIAFHLWKEQYLQSGLRIYIDGSSTPMAAEKIICKDLKNWSPPVTGKVAVDVKLGRLRFHDDDPHPEVRVSFAYGFSDAMGGGPYERPEPDETLGTAITVGAGGDHSMLGDALNAWALAGRPHAVIEFTDSATYDEGALTVKLPATERLIIRAAGGQRPVIRLNQRLTVEGHADSEATLQLIGLAVEGGIEVTKKIARLQLSHCTLVPGWYRKGEKGDPEDDTFESIKATVSGAIGVQVEIDHCITGPLRFKRELDTVRITDSIVDGIGSGDALRGASNQSGAPVWLERTTVLGKVRMKELEASEVIFTDVVKVERQQSGCVRFSHVPSGSTTPRRYRCQPDLALEEAKGKPQAELDRIKRKLAPTFTSRRYGDPAYCQLSFGCAREICTGAEDGAEMGAFHDLKQPQRERNLLTRLEEYLPFGRQAGLIYLT